MKKLRFIFLPAVLAVLILLTIPALADEPIMLPMGEKTPVTLEPGQRLEIPFTPEADGEYFFCQNGNVFVLGLEGAEPTDAWLSNNHVGYSYLLTGGKTYTLYAELPAWYEKSYTTTLLVDLLREAKELSFNRKSIFGYIGDEIQLDLTIQPDHTSRYVQWTSSDEAVARIGFSNYTGCHLELVGIGSAEITAMLDGVTATCTVTVAEPGVFTPGQTQEVTLLPGERQLYHFTPEESGTFVLYHREEILEFGLSALDGTPVEQEYWVVGELNGYRYTLEAGVQYQICAQLWEGYAGTKYDEGYTAPLTLEQTRPIQSMELDQTEIVYYVNHNRYLLAKTDPVYAMMDGITWESADPSIVEIAYSSGDYCELSLLTPGTTVVTATTASGLSASCTVTVLPMPEAELTLREPQVLELPVDSMTHVHFVPKAGGYYQFRLEAAGEMTVDAVVEGQIRSIKLLDGQSDFVTLYVPAEGVSWLDIGSTTGGRLTVTVAESSHDLVQVAPKEPTYEEDGHLGYFRCGVCGRMFHDLDGTEEILDFAELVLPQLQVVPPTGDSNHVDLFVILMILSGCGLVAVLVLARGKKDQ